MRRTRPPAPENTTVALRWVGCAPLTLMRNRVCGSSDAVPRLKKIAPSHVRGPTGESRAAQSTRCCTPERIVPLAAICG